jgi:hypothetical protein
MLGYDNHSHLISGLSVTSIVPSWHKVNLVRVILLDEEWPQSIVFPIHHLSVEMFFTLFRKKG